jgi:hypothetical protein
LHDMARLRAQEARKRRRPDYQRKKEDPFHASCCPSVPHPIR